MRITTTGKFEYQLLHDDDSYAGALLYNDNLFSTGLLCTEIIYEIENIEPGIWVTREKDNKKRTATCIVEVDGKISLQTNSTSYTFIKPVSWKPRFVLLNNHKSEMVALMPSINWLKESCDFAMQINETELDEKDVFIILQALHCAVCSMAMLNGLMVPAVGTIN